MRSKQANVSIQNSYNPGRNWLAAITVAFLAMIERRRQRAALAAILADDRLLKDLGLSRAEALHEVSRPFWR